MLAWHLSTAPTVMYIVRKEDKICHQQSSPRHWFVVQSLAALVSLRLATVVQNAQPHHR